MSRSKGKKSSKRGGGKDAPARVSKTPLAELIETAHVHLAQQNFKDGIGYLKAALRKEPDNKDVQEALGIAECEGGDVEAGRKILLQLIPPHNSRPSSSIYLYLAQTSEDPREALKHYESAISLLSTKIASGSTEEEEVVEEPMGDVVKDVKEGDADEGDDAMVDVDVDDEGVDGDSEEVGEIKKDVVTALIAMVEIWMSDLCFEEDAPTQCDALITRALCILPTDIDARITLANIRMSQSNPDEAKGIVVKAAREVLETVKRMELDLVDGEEVDVDKLVERAEKVEAEAEAGENKIAYLDSSEFPPLPTRRLLARLLLEHSLYTLSLRIIDTVRNEDELDVEGCYLEGWAWYCRGEAIGAGGEEAEGVKKDAIEWAEDEEVVNGLSKEGCWTDALASLAECKSLHEAAEHPDEGILGHALELIDALEKAGIVLEEEVEGEEEPTGADVDMS